MTNQAIPVAFKDLAEPLNDVTVSEALLADCRDSLTSAREECARLREIAARYEWLRAELTRSDMQLGYVPDCIYETTNPDEFDAAIDAELAKGTS